MWGNPVLRPSRHPAKIYALTATKGRREWQVPQPTAGAGVVSFEAKEPGFYLLWPITETSKLLLDETDVPVAWYLDAHQGRAFCAAEKASMWFEPVPGRDFALIMSGKDEGVRMELFDPSGRKVWTDPKVIDWNTYVGRAEGRGNAGELRETFFRCRKTRGALFVRENGAIRRIREDEALAAADLAEALRPLGLHPYVMGDGWAVFEKALRAAGMDYTLAPEMLRYQNAWGVCLAAAHTEPAPPEQLPIRPEPYSY